jgi:hypothetical protein
MNGIKKVKAISEYTYNTDITNIKTMSDEIHTLFELSGKLLTNKLANLNTEYIDEIEEIKKLMEKHQEYINNIKINLDKCLKILNK